jgi:hypothetical protein
LAKARHDLVHAFVRRCHTGLVTYLVVDAVVALRWHRCLDDQDRYSE